MLFNSIDFAIFLPIVFIIYWLLNKQQLKIQNTFLLLVSYYFYGSWDWRFLSLIIFSSCVDYFVALKINSLTNQKERKFFLFLSLLTNLGLLVFFKYYNFFIGNFVNVFTVFGKDFNITTLNIILPIGISFYTFQTLSYTIDVYRKKIIPTTDIVSFFAFVSFFPQLVAGPIERASNLLPQFQKQRTFDYEKSVEGLYLIFKGLFKKMVIADNLTTYVDIVYSDVYSFHGFPLFWATLFFTFQIYCDFSGYSDIAIGTAKLFSFNLMTNFKRPYLATNLKDFWSRWHISLSSWFATYVYIPLGGNRKGEYRTIQNKMITFILSGLWHGANWTFILWGTIHGVFLNLFSNLKYKLPKILKIGFTFFIVSLSWVFFRSESIYGAFYVLKNLFTIDSGIIGVPTITHNEFIHYMLFIILLLIAEINTEYSVLKIGRDISKQSLIFVKIIVLITLIYSFGAFENQSFIYFQF